MGQIISGAEGLSAAEVFEGIYKLANLKRKAKSLLAGSMRSPAGFPNGPAWCGRKTGVHRLRLRSGPYRDQDSAIS